MVKFTKEDAEEIYYALDSKRNAIQAGEYELGDPDADASWIEHLTSIMEHIGADGENLVDDDEIVDAVTEDSQKHEKVYILISGGCFVAAWSTLSNIDDAILIDEDNGEADKETAKENAEVMAEIERGRKDGSIHIIF